MATQLVMNINVNVNYKYNCINWSLIIFIGS